MKKTKEPLLISGRVFVDKLLAYERPDLALKRPFKKGDIKLICVPKQHSSGVRGYSGFFAAYVFDGEGWRKLALRDGAAMKSTYSSVAERARQLEAVRVALRALEERTSVWGDRAYWVPLSTPPAKLSQPQPAMSTGGRPPASSSASKPAPGRQAAAAEKASGQQLLLFR